MSEVQLKEPQNQILKDEEALLLDHEYDGIQELDHPLPQWWLWLFYLTIIFSVFYCLYYLTGWGPTLREELAVTMQEIEAKKPKAPEGGEATDEVYMALLSQPDRIKNGQEVFIGKCAACHGEQGQGLIGPNLTDDYWIHGTGRPTEIAKTIREGVAVKGMPPWDGLLADDELMNVTAYILSIRGSNPPNAKAPEGTEYPAN